MNISALVQAGIPMHKTRRPRRLKTKIFLVMKMTIFLLLAACLQVSAKGYGQKVTITGKDLTLKSVFKEIKKQSDYSFFYSDKDLKSAHRVTLSAHNVDMKTVLDRVFDNQPLGYSIIGKTVVVKAIATSRPATLTFSEVNPLSAVENDQIVTGTVTGQGGLPLAGVSVTVKGSAVGTSTDNNGKFSISVPPNAILVISSVGYVEQEIAVGNKTEINISLNLQTTDLSEVVIVGYGTQKRESLTGSLDVINSKDINDVTSPNIGTMLNGKAPGVYVAPGSGQPGSQASIRIRGQVTLSGSTNPLWVVDGVIMGTDVGDLNPNDIETVSILKDAASTAIFGSQGANGVILVTTKAGKNQKMAVNLSARTGFNELNNGNVKMMSGSELYDYYASFQNADVIRFPRWTPDLRNSNFDWWKLATRKGFTQDYNISLNGGTDKIQNYFSVGYYDEKGAIKGYDYKKYSIRLNTVYKPFKWLTIKPSLSGSKRDVDNRQYSVTAMYSNLPWDSPFDKDGNIVPNRYSGWVNSAGTNYLYDLQWNHGANSNYQLASRIGFDVKITDWLSFSSVNSYEQTIYEQSGYTDPRSSAGQSVGGRISDYRSRGATRYTNQILRFNQDWGNHHLDGLVAYEFNDFRSKTLDVSGIGFIPGFEVLDVVSKPEKTKGGITEWAVQSVLSKADYNYSGKYLFEASFRRDGASNFGDNAKYGNFFSVSGGWNITRENWFKVDWINNLKLRASYGSVGNRPSSLYPQYDLYSVSSSYDQQPGALISQIGNENLTWEKTLTSDFGFDGAFLDNRLRITFDYYTKKTDNILYQVPISGLTGVTSIWRNIGKMKNNGVEFNIGTDIIRKKDIQWSLNVNMGHNTNKLTQLYKTKDAHGNFVVNPIIISDGLGIAGSAQRLLLPGLPIDTYYLIEWAGVNPDNGAPMWYKITKDANGDVTSKETTSNYAQATYTTVGSASPDVFGGFTTSLTYKKFDVTALFGYALGGQIYNYSRQEYDADGTYTDRNQMVLMKGWSRWEKPGDIATHPVAKYNNPDHGNSASSRFLENGSYLKLRSLILSYNLDLPRLSLKHANVFVSGENLFTITKYSGVDPEIPVSGGTILSSTGPGVYPSKRVFTVGLNVTFN